MIVRFKPDHAESWGISPDEEFFVRDHSRLAVIINFKGRTVHVSKSILIIEEDEVADPETPTEYPKPAMEQAKEMVQDYVVKHLDKSDPEVDFQVYIVWFTKTLQNWKAMLSTTLPDKMYYEVTHDGANHCTYLDAYVKLDNITIHDGWKGK